MAEIFDNPDKTRDHLIGKQTRDSNTEEILNENEQPPGPSASPDAARRSAQSMALRLLSRRNHTCRELHRKLRQRGVDSDIADQVVAECKRCRYLDDEAFARSYRKHMVKKGYGARRIRLAMKQKGLRRRHIDAAFSDPDMAWDERALAQSVLAQKAKTLSHLPSDRKKKEKLYRFLYSRGFSSSTIIDLLKGL